MNLKKSGRYLRVNLLGPGPLLIKKEFTGPIAICHGYVVFVILEH